MFRYIILISGLAAFCFSCTSSSDSNEEQVVCFPALTGVSLEEQIEDVNQVDSLLLRIDRARSKAKYPCFVALSLRKIELWEEIGQDSLSMMLMDSLLQKAEIEKWEPDSSLAMVWHKKGLDSYSENDYNKSLVYFTKAFGIRKKIFDLDHVEIARSLNNIGSVYVENNQPDSAIVYLEQSISISLDSIQSFRAFSHRQLAKAYRMTGNNYLANKHYNLSCSKYLQIEKNDSIALIKPYIDYTYFLSESKNYREAVKYSETGRRIIRNRDNEISKSNIDKYLKLCLNQSLAHAFLGEPEQVNVILNDLNSYDFETTAITPIHFNLGVAYQKSNNYEAAKALYLRLLAGELPTENKNWIYHNLAEVAEIQGNIPEAIRYQEEGLRNWMPKGDAPLRARLLGKHTDYFLYAGTLARLYGKRALEDKLQANVWDAKAGALYDSITTVADRVRLSLTLDESKTELAGTLRSVYQEALLNSWHQYQLSGTREALDAALRYMGRMKSLCLLDAVASGQGVLSLSQQKQELVFKQAITDAQRDITLAEESGDEQAVKQGQAALLQAEQQLMLFSRKLMAENPAYFNRMYGVGNVQLAQIQENLGKNQAYLEYAVAGDTLLVLCVTPASYTMVPLGAVDSVNKAILQLRKALNAQLNPELESKEEESEQETQPYVLPARRLYDQLWKPLAGKLPRHIILVTDGQLPLVPFDALLASDPVKPNNPSSWSWLIKDHVIQHQYGAALWLELQKRKPVERTTDKILAIAPDFTQHASVASVTRQNRQLPDSTGLGVLLFNTREVASLSKKYACDVQTKEAANRTAFIQTCGGYPFLHLATHGFADPEQPQRSFLAFTQPFDKISYTELLYAHDIYNLPIQADMVVLSACETGMGQVVDGEGVISVGRSFLYAGASSVVNTLWSISDQKSQKLMEAFYDALGEGLTKDEALYQAKLSLLENHSTAEPVYWAAFTATGNMDAVDLPKRSLRWWWVVLAGAGVLALVWWRAVFGRIHEYKGGFKSALILMYSPLLCTAQALEVFLG